MWPPGTAQSGRNPQVENRWTRGKAFNPRQSTTGAKITTTDSGVQGTPKSKVLWIPALCHICGTTYCCVLLGWAEVVGCH